MLCEVLQAVSLPLLPMAQILDPLPSDDAEVILCCYVNATSKIQIARITNVPDWYFERVVFPGQRLMFESVRVAHLEIHTGMMASSILSDTIPCERLVVEAQGEEEAVDDPPEDEAGHSQQEVAHPYAVQGVVKGSEIIGSVASVSGAVGGAGPVAAAAIAKPLQAKPLLS